MTVLILGGSKSGKSDYAQQVALRLANGGRHYYVATMMPTSCDADSAIIRSHLQRRAGMDFETIEQGKDILSAVREPDAAYLLDSVSTLLTNALYPAENGYQPDEIAAIRCGEDLIAFLRSVRNAVIVSDDLFRDGVRYDGHTEVFRRHLGAIHRRLAEECDVVIEMVFGRPVIHKGEWK